MSECRLMKHHGDRVRRANADDGARERVASRLMVMRLRVEIASERSNSRRILVSGKPDASFEC